MPLRPILLCGMQHSHAAVRRSAEQTRKRHRLLSGVSCRSAGAQTVQGADAHNPHLARTSRSVRNSKESIMKASLKSGLAALVFAATLSSPVYAQHGHGGGHGGGWGLGGLVVGAAIFGLAAQSAYQYSYPYPYQNPYPSPYEPPAPIYVQPAYVQPPQQAMAVPAMASWYFCRDSQAYYPYVQSCAAGWERVPASPLGQ